MSNRGGSEVPLEAANALATYLRRNPEEANRSADELAAKFGLPPAFVYSMLDALKPPQPEGSPSVLRMSVSFEPIHRLWRAIVLRFDRLTSNPMRFIAWTLVLSVLVMASMVLVRQYFGTATERSGVSLPLTAAAVAGVGTLALHMACYFRRAMARFALLGGLLVWVCTSIPLMILFWASASRTPESEAQRSVLVMLIPATVAILAAIYVLIGSLASILGGYVRLRQTERRRDQMTRQERLERYIAIRSRLAESSDVADESSWTDKVPYIEIARAHPFLVAVLAGNFLSAITFASAMWGGPAAMTGRDVLTTTQVIMVGVSTVMLLAQVGLYVAIGFLARRYWRALLVALVVVACQAVWSVALRYRMPEAAGSWVIAATSSLAMLVFTAVSAWGAHIQRGFARQRKLVRNDKATLLAEMVQLRWELSSEDVEVCVLCVDAARSSEMKSTADPFVVEYSFRRYQEWLGATAARFGGRVHSTAGDGAVIAFDHARDAFHAARQIQSDLERFNREDNRLNKPFRIRLGLHVGRVTADLDQVQFSEVIDIAAHVQQVSPIGGIALTQAAAAEIEGEEFVALTKEVDGQSVMLALNPTNP